jgi:hypothetical protein
MKPNLAVFALILMVAALACNFPSNVPVTETPTIEAQVMPSATQPVSTDMPTLTPVPTLTPLPTMSPTPTIPIAFPKDVAVNCRFGPGTEWIVLSGLSVGQSSQIVGKSADFNWWYIVDPLNASRNCWVAASVTNTAGNVTPIPVVQAPQASVTNVTVKIDPKTISVAGCMGPIPASKIEGTIEVNGPTTVKWYFETQQGGAMSVQTTNFDTAGPRTFSAEYTPTITAGTYWVRMITSSPNNIQAETSYKIECP